MALAGTIERSGLPGLALSTSAEDLLGADVDSLSAKAIGLLSLVAGNEPPCGGDDSPPWESLASREHAAYGSRGPWVAGLLRNLAVRGQLA